MLFLLGLPPDSRCKFFNPDPPVKKNYNLSDVFVPLITVIAVSVASKGLNDTLSGRYSRIVIICGSRCRKAKLIALPSHHNNPVWRAYRV